MQFYEHIAAIVAALAEQVTPGPYATVVALSAKANDAAVVHLTGNETTAGAKIFSSAAVGIVPLTAKGAVGQTAPLQEWRDGAWVIKATLSNVGNFILDTPGVGIYVRSPNNTRYKISVSDAGVLTAVVG